MSKENVKIVAANYLLPFVLITLLFFLWGGARAILDVLNKHFQSEMDITKTQSAFMQAATYGAYFLGALPAGYMIRKIGTRKGVIAGLLLFATGAFLFIPVQAIASFSYVVFPLFVIGCGLVILETAANPYVTLLGDPRTSAGRLNIAQSFNGLGCIMGVLLGGQFFFREGTAEPVNIAVPYTVIGVIVLIVALCFTKIKLPEVLFESCNNENTVKQKLGFAFFFGVAAMVCYEIAEISINTFFINFMTDDGFMSANQASLVLSLAGLGLFMLGRVAGGSLMKYVAAEKIMFVCSCGTLLTILLTMLPLGSVAKGALVVCYVFESIMFPTIFALSIRGLGANTERASSILMMCVVGGVVGPLLMGMIADSYNIVAAFIVPFIAFVVVFAFALFHLLRNLRESKV